MPPRATRRGELSPVSGRPIPNPEPVQAAILSDRSLAVKFEGGPWVRPTVEETRAYAPVLRRQDGPPPSREWYFQCISGVVRFTTNKDDKLNSRIGNKEEQNEYRRLFEGDQTAQEPKRFTSILPVSDIKTMSSALANPQRDEPIPDANIPIPADVMPIDIGPTPFAHAYSSKGLATMTDKFPLLQALNCSYLSTLHHAPTLLELKQHAQALTVLINEISGPSTSSAQVNNEGMSTRTFTDGEPFDWLNDLSKPYVNVDPKHSIPLTTLMNLYHHDPKAVRTTHVCPLSSIPRTKDERDAGQPGLPYMTHEELTKHANECLEILDHEFSAEGGLLAILPDMENESDRTLSGRTLLGQFILFTQRLVQRVHELELKAANAADLLSGEKVIPTQTLGLIPGLNGRDFTRPATVSYPQHKYVLANAGAQVWGELTKMLNEKEKMDRDLHNYNVQQGLSAASQWEANRTIDYRNGLTHIDVMTRYTRTWDVNSIAGTSSTIFIIPAYAVHPGVAATRNMESKPQVVQVVKPQYPERLSVLEEKYEEKKYKYEDIIMEHRRLKQDNEDHLETIAVQQQMYKDLQAENSYRRAEQQGRGMQDLAGFRNPIAEKEKKLDETQRDLDKKLLATEYALRDAQRQEQAAQGELKRIKSARGKSEDEFRAIVSRNEALTTGVRAGYLLNAPITSDGLFHDPAVKGRQRIDKYGETVGADKIQDVTDQVLPNPEFPLPANFNGVKTYIDAAGMYKSQTIIDGISGNEQDATPAEKVKFYERMANIRTGYKKAPAGPPFVITMLPGLTWSDDGPEVSGSGSGETAIRADKGNGTVPIRPGPSVTGTQPVNVQSTTGSRSQKSATRTPALRGSQGSRNENFDWNTITNDDRWTILIAAAMDALGWVRSYQTFDRLASYADEEIPLWYNKVTGETIADSDWREKLISARAPAPIVRTRKPDWKSVTQVHLESAMIDAWWDKVVQADGSVMWYRSIGRTVDGDEEPEEQEEISNDEARKWLADMASKAVYLKSYAGVPWEVRATILSNLGFSMVDYANKGAEYDDWRWTFMADGQNWDAVDKDLPAWEPMPSGKATEYLEGLYGTDDTFPSSSA